MNRLSESPRDADTGPSKLPGPWRAWLVKNKLLGYDDETLIERLSNHGFSRESAARELAAIAVHPYVQGAGEIARHFRRREQLHETYRILHASSGRYRSVKFETNLKAAEFYEHYYTANRPVILGGLIDDWPALEKWTPSFFKALFGELTVEVQAGRSSDPDFELNAETHRSRMPFDKFIDSITGCPGNDMYMTGNNYFMRRAEASPLYADIPIPEGYLDPETLLGHVSLWFGGAGTVTPLHHDLQNVFMAQVRGKKKVILIPSFETHLVYNRTGVFSETGFERRDPERFPLLEHASSAEVILEPGQVLFVPVGWWHHVKSLDLSLTVTFSNFLGGNRYPLEMD